MELVEGNRHGRILVAVEITMNEHVVGKIMRSMSQSMNGDASPAPDVSRVHLTRDPETLKQGSEQWKRAVEEVREALDAHGYFLVKYDAISKDDRERLCEAMHSVFSLPVETKGGSTLPDEKFPRYIAKSSHLPLYETLRVGDASERETAEAFTRLMWPAGNDEFCNAVHSMGSKMTELTRVLNGMILDAYGLGKYQEAVLDASEPEFLMIKYSALEEEGQALGLLSHADPNYITVLGQNGVSGLTIKNNQGCWVQVDPGQGYFVAFAGQSLRAATNGRVQATYHQVHIRAVKDRLSYAVFLTPKPDQVIDALPGMVDDQHPRLFKPFRYGEFSRVYRLQGSRGDDLSRLAGV